MSGAGLAVFLALFGAWEAPSREGNRLQLQGKHREADARYRQALRALEALGRRDVVYATVRNNSATLAESEGRYDEAEAGFRDAARVLEHAGPKYDAERARMCTNLGSLAMRRGRFSESVQWLTQARVIQQRLRSSALGRTLLALANLELLRRDTGAAARWLEQSWQAMDHFGRERDDESSWHITRCWHLTLSARNGEARRACEIAHETVISEVGAEHARMAVLELHRAQLSKQMGQLDGAAESYREAAGIFANLNGPQSVPYARAIMGLAHVRRMQRQFPSAASLAQRALRVFSSANDASPLDRQAALQLVADLDRLEGRHAEAEQTVRQAIRLAEQTAGADSPAVSDSLNTLAVILYQRPETLDEAGTLLERCLAIRTARYGPLHLYLAEPTSNLGFVRNSQRRFAEAAGLFERSLALRQEAVGTDHQSLAPILLGYAQALDGLGDKSQAKWARSTAKRLAASPDNPSRHVISYADLGGR